MTEEPVVPIDPVDRTPYQQIMKAYNEAVAGTPLPKCMAMSDRRKIALKVRWAEPLFAGHYVELFRKAAAAPLLRGENPSPGHLKWKGSLDWLIENNGNYVKVLEGKYDAEPKPPDSRDMLKTLPDAGLIEARDEFEAHCKDRKIKAAFAWSGYSYYDLMAEWIRRGMVKDKGDVK